MDPIVIDSFEDPRLDVFARLTEAQLRNRLEPEKGIFIAESPKVIERALAAGMEPLSFLMEEKWIESMIPLVDSCIVGTGKDIPLFTGKRDMLEKLTGFTLTRGVLCAMRRPKLPAVEELLRDACRVAVLDGIVDHTNVGAIFRSAAALGVDAVLVAPTCCDPLYRRAVRVSMGTIFQVPWTRIGETVGDWPEAGMKVLADCGFKTAAFALRDDSLTLGQLAEKDCDKLALVFGTEGNGLSQEAIDGCDYVVRIPMRHGVDSLNVAAASAVAFYALVGE